MYLSTDTRFRKGFHRAALILMAAATGVAATLLLVISLTHAQHVRANSSPPLMPDGVEAVITITLAAANMPTQTTLISVTNPTTLPAAINIIFYKGSAVNNQLACSLGPDIILATSTVVYTVTETPGCANQTFSGDAVLGASQAVTATSLIQRITTHYVASNADCGNVGRCYATLQAAADIAESGDAIKVAQGVYTSQAFQVLFLNRAITVTGGFTKTDWVTAYPITQPVVLDAQNNPGQRVVQVVGTGTGTLTLDGLVVQRGNLSNETDAAASVGAGINVVTGMVVIRNSQILNNAAASGAGVNSAGTLSLAQTVLRDNEASNAGAGAALRAVNGAVNIASSQFINNRFVTGTNILLRGAIDTQNSALTVDSSQVEGTTGIGIYAQGGLVSIANSQVRNNVGSGIALNNSDARVISNTIELNGNASYEGGGIAFNSTCQGQLYLANNVIRKNVATQGGGLGGRVGPITLVNNTFQDNRALIAGGALQLQKDSVVVCLVPPVGSLQGNRLIGNSAPKAGAILIDTDYRVQGSNDIVANNVTSGFQTAAVHVGTGNLDVRHWTMVGNGRYAISTGSGAAALTNTIVATHSVAGLAGNISSNYTLFFDNGSTCSNGATCANDRAGDPRFFWPQLNDYHLCQNSAAIDQGVNAGVSSDFEGDARPQGIGVDIGADEWNEVSCKRLRTVFVPSLLRPGIL